ncbi:Aste57867_1074 [Aphanomyces stellatus]|uniref:Aste57867_1074 protein n=1 Tax=Aphanomyces stellatus TaxID=120398 RepID=A0A485K4Q9_9STRA|nr:hypothetical protein As57867_001073 [Aphanomyces stellatus]VFT78296.1 Aste57867_1074 [Aphanomyces stellatus]
MFTFAQLVTTVVLLAATASGQCQLEDTIGANKPLFAMAKAPFSFRFKQDKATYFAVHIASLDIPVGEKCQPVQRPLQSNDPSHYWTSSYFRRPKSASRRQLGCRPCVDLVVGRNPVGKFVTTIASSRVCEWLAGV